MYNIFPGDGSANSGQIVYTDLYIQYSINGGISWSDHSIKLPASFPSMTEQYPICWHEIEDIGFPFFFKAHYIYQYDAIPGVSIFNTTVPIRMEQVLREVGTMIIICLSSQVLRKQIPF